MRRDNAAGKVAPMKFLGVLLLILGWTGAATGRAADDNDVTPLIFSPGHLKPVDSVLKVKVGEKAPTFSLPAVTGGRVALAGFRGRKNVLISFVPAAFTPVCSAQWPGYQLARDMFDQRDVVLLGITTDNIPSLYAWTRAMGGVWFPVLSDFYPHGEVARKFGVLRSDGMAERALFLVDKRGVIRWIDVHDINQRPPLEDLEQALEKLPR